MTRRLSLVTETLRATAMLLPANPAVWWWLKNNHKITNLRVLSPNVYVLALGFREMVPSFLSGRSVENGHNLLNFGEQGSQTRQVIYVVITIGKQSKDTRSLWMMSQWSNIINIHPICVFLYLHFSKVGEVSLQDCLHNFRLKWILDMSGKKSWAFTSKHCLVLALKCVLTDLYT